MMPRPPRPGETREEYSAFLEEFKANPPTLPRPRRRRDGWSSMVPWRNPPEGMSPLSDTLGLGNLADKLRALAKEGGVPRNEPGPGGGFFTGPLTKYIEPTPTDDLIPYPEDAGPDFPPREDIVARDESYEHWRQAEDQRRQGLADTMAVSRILGDNPLSNLRELFEEKINVPAIAMADGGVPQQMLGRRSPPPNWPGQQPQGWPGQQPGFNLQEATGALATAQGLLGDASSEITAADMEPLSNARGMVSQAQHVLSRGFGPPRQQTRVPRPWGGEGSGALDTAQVLFGDRLAGAQQVAGVGPLADLLSPPTTPQDLGPQGIAPPMLPAFMANGGPAETTGIGPLYMNEGGLTFGAGDAIGLAASAADNLGAFGKLSGITGPIGIGLGIFNAMRTGNPRDAIPFNLGNVIYQKFFESPEDERERTQGPEWDKSTKLTGPSVIRGPLNPALYPAPGTRQLGPGENPFDPGDSTTGPLGPGGIGGYGGDDDGGYTAGGGDESGASGVSYYQQGGLASLL